MKEFAVHPTMSSPEHLAQNVVDKARQSAIDQRARDAAQPKPVSSGNIPREVKTEIENLRRLVQTIQDRLHVLARM